MFMKTYAQTRPAAISTRPRAALAGAVLALLAGAGSGATAAQGVLDPRLVPGTVMGQSGEEMLDERVARLERILENQRGSDLLLQMQQLQQEIQELRGLVETQQFELQKLTRQQRDRFMDIDARLRGGTAGGGPDGEGAPGGADPALAGQPGAGDGQTGFRTDGLGAIDASGADLSPPPGEAPPPPVGAPAASTGPVGIPSLPSPETNAGNERDGYREAFELLKQRKYPEAAEAFNALLHRFPQGEYTDNARYWLGETYYVQRNFPAALAEFDRLVQLSPGSPKVPGALLKIGYIQYEQQAYAQARAALQQVIAKYPDSTEARLAKSRLDRIGRDSR